MISHVNSPRLPLKNLHWITTRCSAAFSFWQDNNLPFFLPSLRRAALSLFSRARLKLFHDAEFLTSTHPKQLYPSLPLSSSSSSSFDFLYRNRVHCKLIMLRVNPMLTEDLTVQPHYNGSRWLKEEKFFGGWKFIFSFFLNTQQQKNGERRKMSKI